MKKHILILGLILMFFGMTTYAQTTVSIPDTNAVAGEMILPVNAAGLGDIGSMTLNITYDEDVLEFVEFVNNPFEGDPNFIVNTNQAGKLTVVWFSASSVNITDKIFDLKFNYSGGYSAVAFTGANEFTDESAQALNVTFEDGEVAEIPATLTLSDVVSLPGESVTVSLNGTNLENIGSMTLFVSWDPDVVEFTGLANDNVGFEDPGTGENGSITLTWFSLNPLSIADGKLADLQFDYVNGSTDVEFGASSEVTDEEGDPITVVFNDGSVGAPQLGLSFPDVETANNTEVNLPLNATLFDNVGSFTVKVDYDTAYMMYNRTENLVSGDLEVYENNPGQLTLAYININGLTIDSGKVVDLVFDFEYSGTTNLTTDVEFVEAESEVTDVDSNVLSAAFTDGSVTLVPMNNAPEFVTTLPDTTVMEGDTLAFTYVATDADADTLEYYLVEGPGTINSVSGLYTAMPVAGDAGVYTLTVGVTDGEDSVSTSSTITVEEEPSPVPEPPMPPHDYGDTLNVNGSFEYSELGDAVGTYYWSIAANLTGASATIVEDDQDGDGRALMMEAGSAGTGNAWDLEVVNEPFYPAEGDMFVASVWMKASDTGRIADLYLGLPASANWQRKPDFGNEERAELTTEWQEFSFPIYTADAQDEAESMRFGIEMNFAENNGATIYIDNVTVIKQVPPPPRPPHEKGDIINVNGSFEYSELGDAVGTHYWSIAANLAGASATIIEDDQDGDNRALEIMAGAAGTGNAWDLEVVNEPFYPAEGDSIRLSVWLKGDQDGRIAELYLGLPASANWQRKPDFDSDERVTLTTEWDQYFFPVYVVDDQDEAESMRFGIEFNFAENADGIIYVDNAVVQKVGEVGVEDITTTVPKDYGLAQNYPNPFNPTTSIQFSLPQQSQVSLTIYNILGQEVSTLVNKEMSAGKYNFQFDASNMVSGMYIYRLKAIGIDGKNFTDVKKMLLIK